MGLAGVAESVSAEESFESTLGVLKIAAGIFTGPRQVADGFIFPCGDIDPGESTRARQPGPWHGVPTVGFDAGTSLLGHA